MSQVKIKIDIAKLEALQKQLKTRFSIKVGILGADGSKNRKEGINNAELGAIHEFGSISRNIPRRSFLFEPINQKLPDVIKGLGKDYFNDLAAEDLEKFFKNLGLECEGIVDDAFATRGFGKWAPNTPATVRAKGSDAPLIDTGQLRRSITSKVTKGKL